MTDTPKVDWVCDLDGDAGFERMDRDQLADDFIGGLWEPREFATSIKGPPVWAVEVVLTRDEAGDADETEVRWFWSLEEAQAAAKHGVTA